MTYVDDAACIDVAAEVPAHQPGRPLQAVSTMTPPAAAGGDGWAPRTVPAEFGSGQNVDKLWLHAAALAGPAPVIAVSSADGGVGRSVVTAAVGAVLALAVPRPVVAVDAAGDTFGDLATYAADAGEQTATVWDAVQTGDRLPEVIDGLWRVGPTGLRVIAGEPQLQPPDRRPVTVAELAGLVSRLRMRSGLVLLDLPPATTAAVWEALVAAAAPIVVARASVTSIRHVMRLLAQLRAAGLDAVASRATVLVMAASQQVPREVLAAERQAAGQARGLVRVPYDPVLARAAAVDPRSLRRPARTALLWAAGSAVQLCPIDAGLTHDQQQERGAGG